MIKSAKVWNRVIRKAMKDILVLCDHPLKWDNNDFLSAILFIFRDDYKVYFGTRPCVECKGQKGQECIQCEGKGELDVEAPLQDILEVTSYIYEVCGETFSLPTSARKIREMIQEVITDKSIFEKIKKKEK